VLAYFPEIMPDELLYSTLARLGRHRATGASSRFMEELFGRSHAIASFDLPGGIGALVERLGSASGLDADAIIRRATLFPFHTAFVSAEVRDTTWRAMVESTVGVHLRLGLAASRIPVLHALRFCPACLDAMITEGGERYWRRAHQLPGITVCADHGVPLLRAPVYARRTGRHGFVAADDADLAVRGAGAPVIAPQIMERLQGLATAAVQLLESSPAPLEPMEVSEGYRARLARVGLATGAKVHQADLEQAFCRHWGAALHHVPGVLSGNALRGGWLASLVRPRPRAMHPVYHLLLTLFLDQLAEVEPPFGYGPWECLNPLASHCGDPVVSSVRVRRDRSHLYGDFECACGYVYTRTRGADGSVGSARYRSYGSSFAPALSAAIAGGEGLRAVARRLKLDPKTVMREAAIAGIATPWRVMPSGAVSLTTCTGSRRRPQPHARTSSHGGCKRDWSFTDRLLAKAVGAEVAIIRSIMPPVRVTFSELERRMTSRSWIRDRRAKLPRTIERISSLVESTDAFRRRRLDFALCDMEGAAEITASAVVRSAGLPIAWMSRVRAAIAARNEAGMEQAA
jgi:hypothetical protein